MRFEACAIGFKRGACVPFCVYFAVNSQKSELLRPNSRSLYPKNQHSQSLPKPLPPAQKRAALRSPLVRKAGGGKLL